MDTKSLGSHNRPGILLIVILSRLELRSIVGTWGVEEASAMSTLGRVTQLIPPSGRMAEIFDVLVLAGQHGCTRQVPPEWTPMVTLACPEVPPTKRLMSEVRSAGRHRRRN